MRKIKLTIAYDGTGYYGWQKQKGLITVQQTLEEGLCKIFGEKITLVASGRTDTGVHALGQVVSFATKGKIPTDKIVKAARTVLPSAIAVLLAEEVPEDFHARYSAKGKQYLYKIIQTELPDPFQENYAWLLAKQLDMDSMTQAAELIVGEHDFSSFRASGSTPTQPVRTVYAASWSKIEKQLIFTIKGTGFLYHMVRNLVGSFVDVGTRKISVVDFTKIFLAKDRKLAGKTAPAQGLYLEKVFY